MKNTMGETAWSYHAEKAAQLPSHIWDIGVGKHLSKEAGLSEQAICEGLGPNLYTLIDGGANSILLETNHLKVMCYVRRRGQSIDIGNRQDFQELGWEKLCTEFDRQSQDN